MQDRWPPGVPPNPSQPQLQAPPPVAPGNGPRWIMVQHGAAMQGDR